LSAIGVTADKAGFWREMVCPLLTQSGHQRNVLKYVPEKFETEPLPVQIVYPSFETKVRTFIDECADIDECAEKFTQVSFE
jgi:hypothetical protein